MRVTIITVIAIAVLQASCDKHTAAPQTSKAEAVNETNNGPYGLLSKWKSLGGDSLFGEELVLTLFYTEPHSPCDICHYQLNYSLWNDYEYTYSTSKCTIPNDTLIMTDLATAKRAFFQRIYN